MSADINSTINWQTLVFQSGWLQKLDHLAAKRFGNGGLAEEAGTYVIEKLSANQWQCLSSFKGQCRPESFLHTVTSNFLEEFSRHRFGRLRPPEWLKRQGTLWLQIWKMICLERQLVQSVIEQLCSSSLREITIIKDAIRTIKARQPWCGGESPREVIHNADDSEDDNPADLITTTETPELSVTEAAYTDTLLLISSLMNDAPIEQMFGSAATEHAKKFVKTNRSKFDNLHQKLKLTDEDKVILRMYFQDGLKKTVIAKSLGMPEHLPGRKIKQILANISQTFQELDIDLDELNELSIELSE